jgi:hypothetical protein
MPLEALVAITTLHLNLQKFMIQGPKSGDYYPPCINQEELYQLQFLQMEFMQLVDLMDVIT